VSGFVGIWNRDGQPVESRLLRRMTDALAFRGPDAQRTWIDGAVGLGHALLSRSPSALDEHQPSSLDGAVRIVGDVRVDGRADLVRALASQGHRVAASATDAELVLYAYHAWGEGCVSRLLGDFAFTIWDGRRRRLFCARDQFGVKPFFYAEVGDRLLVGNTLQCLRLDPAVSPRLNEQAVGDFLLFGMNQDLSTTVFADLRRLPPAHCLTAGPELRVSRYWTLPADEAVRYRRAGEYLERFQELFGAAVADRLRTDRAGILMSGGLDSTSVAATARGRTADGGKPCLLRAYTSTCSRLLPDEEARFAAIAAAALNIPIVYRAEDDLRPFDGWDKAERRRPEPESDPLAGAEADLLRMIGAECRVLLTGYGGDPVFRTPVTYPLRLLRQGRVAALAGEVWQHLRVHGRLPPIRPLAWLAQWTAPADPPTSYPGWLNPDFETRLDLRARWAAAPAEQAIAPQGCARPEAYEFLTAPDWPALFESYDPGVTGVPVDLRHPFFDLRVVRYLLAIPAIPWCTNKAILRLAMQGLLPDEVRRRPKTVAAGDLLTALLKDGSPSWAARWPIAPELTTYVNPDAIPSPHGEQDPDRLWMNLRPYCLSFWLMQEALMPT
jgi:asparagine synthase (glutamine-hydrolysing)